MDTERRLMSDTLHVKNRTNHSYMTAIDMQCIHKIIIFVHQPTYPHSASLRAQPCKIVIYPLWHMMMCSEQKFNKFQI